MIAFVVAAHLAMFGTPVEFVSYGCGRSVCYPSYWRGGSLCSDRTVVRGRLRVDRVRCRSFGARW